MKKIFFATSNKRKLLEAEKFLSPLGFDVEQFKIYYPEIQASKLEEVAHFGIEWIFKESEEKTVIIEDAGLFIHVLSNFPGVYSKYVFETVGLSGILGLMEGREDRSAHFESCIGYYDKESGILLFKGDVDGIISPVAKGQHDFGYDPIFIPKGEQKTFAEMKIEEKNKYSHRARALEKLAEFLRKG